MFWQSFSQSPYKAHLRVAVFLGCFAFLSFLGYSIAYHREWFNVPFSKYAAIKLFIKSIKWIVLIVAFWIGKKYLTKESKEESTSD